MDDAESKAMMEQLGILANDILTELNISSFNELVRVTGLAQAMPTMRLYKKRNLYMLLSEVRKNLGLKGTGIDALVIPLFFAQCALGNPKNVSCEIKERGAEGTVKDCIYKDASPEFCIFISHFTTEPLCEAIDPSYESFWTHHMTSGDPYCRYVFVKKSDDKKGLEDLGKTISVIPSPNVPKEQLMAMKSWILFHFWDAVTESFTDIHGSQKTVEILGANARRIGLNVGSMMLQSNPALKGDAQALGHLIDLFGMIMNQKGAVLSSSKDIFTKEITDCPFQIFPYEMCKQFEALFQGICGSIDPDLEFHYTKAMTMGDETCAWSVSNKLIDASKLEEAQLVRNIEDPLKILKIRLARGEITKQEFEDLKEIVS